MPCIHPTNPRIANLFAYHEKLKKKRARAADEIPDTDTGIAHPERLRQPGESLDEPVGHILHPLDNNLYPEVPQQAVDDFHRALALAEPRGKAIDFTGVARG